MAGCDGCLMPSSVSKSSSERPGNRSLGRYLNNRYTRTEALMFAVALTFGLAGIAWAIAASPRFRLYEWAFLAPAFVLLWTLTIMRARRNAREMQQRTNRPGPKTG